jgi:hypothetical protein
MQIREATIQDTERWNAFVEAEGGSFFHYFEWKTIYEANKWHYFPLMVENNANEILGILPFVEIQGFLQTRLVSLPEGASGGFILKKNLQLTEKQQATQLLISYIDKYFSKGCSTFYLKENLSLQDIMKSKPTELLVKNGFSFRGYSESRLPCTYRLALSSSFENDIWHGLWGAYLRNHIRKSQRQGVVVREDTKLQYRDEIIDMMRSIYQKFDQPAPSKEEVLLRLTAFKGKTKVWVAFLDDVPIAALLCYYDASFICYASKLGYKNPARENYTTVLLFSEAIGDACENGYQYFDFGTTETVTLAKWKEQFKPMKMPMRMYEKNYSTIRTFFQKTPAVLKWSLKNKQYVWDHRKKILRKIIKI